MSTYNETVEHTVSPQTTIADLSYELVFGNWIEHAVPVSQDISHFVATGGSLTFDLESVVVVDQDITVSVHRTRAVEHTVDVDNYPEYVAELQTETWSLVEVQQDIAYSIAYAREVEHTVTVEQDITSSGVHVQAVEHALVFTQDISSDGTISTTKPVENTVTVTQDVSYSGVFSRSIEHTLSVTQAITEQLEDSSGSSCDRRDLKYSPGGTLTAAPSISLQNAFVLSYPTSSPTTTVSLPAPILTNREEIETTRIQRKTRGGKLITYRDETWPDTVTLRVKFEGMNHRQRKELFEFIQDTLGLEIKMVDHENRTWHGFIVNPQGEHSQLVREHGHFAEFDFQGVEQ